MHMTAKYRLHKGAFLGIKYSAADAWELVRRVKFSFTEMMELISQDAGMDTDDAHFVAACQYLRNHPAKWRSWVEPTGSVWLAVWPSGVFFVVYML